MTTTLKQVLTIAGSDSGGGAGIQADIKAMSANGVFAMSVITAITAQNTEEVTDIFEVPPSVIAAQIDAVFDDFEIAAVKTGMLSSVPIVETVAKMLKPPAGIQPGGRPRDDLKERTYPFEARRDRSDEEATVSDRSPRHAERP